MIVARGLLTFHLFDFFSLNGCVGLRQPGVRLIEQILTAPGDENADDGQVRRMDPNLAQSDERGFLEVSAGLDVGETSLPAWLVVS